MVRVTRPSSLPQIRRAAQRAARGLFARPRLVELLEPRRMLSAVTLRVTTTTDYGDPGLENVVVATGKPLSLRDAIGAANVDAATGQTVSIELAANTAYTLTGTPISEFTNLPAAGGNPQVSAAAAVTIDGNGSTVTLGSTDLQFLQVEGSSNVTLNSLTVTGGTNELGGAVAVTGSASLSANGVTFSDNAANPGQAPQGGEAGAVAAGGAVYITSSGASTFTNDTFSDNSALGGQGNNGGQNVGFKGGAGQGGAVADLGTGAVTFTGTTFSRNSATGGETGNNNNGVGDGGLTTYAPGQGGAVYAASGTRLSFVNDTLSSNTATGHAGESKFNGQGNGEDGGLGQGGAVYVGTATVSFSGGTVNANQAVGGAGGGEQENARGGKGGDGQGGAFYVDGGSLTLTNTATNSNTAAGGLTGYADNDGVLVTNGEPGTDTIYTNVIDYGASQGGGIYAAGNSTVVDAGGSLENNSVNGFDGQSGFYQSNGEDGGNAEGGGLYEDLSGGSVQLSGGLYVDGNRAVGGTGGSSYGGSQDKSGAGGNGVGGAAYVIAGPLTVDGATLLNNVATAGANGTGQYGVVAAETSITDPPSTPSLDPTRYGLSQGGAVYDTGGGNLTVNDALVQDNDAIAPNQSFFGSVAAAGSFGISLQYGRVGGSAQGGAFYLAPNTNSSLNVTGSQFVANAAEAGNGSESYTETLGIYGGSSEQTGGDGGNADGGGIYLNAAATQTMDLTSDLFGQNGAYGGQGGSAPSGFGGTNGVGAGGAVYVASGRVAASTVVLDQNFAWGGPQSSLTGATAGGNGGYGGGAGGNGGAAYGGGIDVEAGSLSLTSSVLELNQAFGGNGAAGFDGTSVGDNDGDPGGNGGNGGNAYGGGVYADAGVAVTLSGDALRENLVLGGGGGRGGDGEGDAYHPKDSGGGGGQAGSGGSGYGGAVALRDASPTLAAPTLVAVGVANTRFVGNQVGGGDGGEGGNSGYGGNGETGSQVDNTGTYHGGSGGPAGSGGNAGTAEGAAVWNAGAAMTVTSSSFSENTVTGGWGGDGGIGGPGGDGEPNNPQQIEGGHRDSYGGYGGAGGNGGGGGNATGAALALDDGSISLTSSSLLYNTATAGFGGDGGQGGIAGQGVQGDPGGDGGNGGNGGAGGTATGGGLYLGVSSLYGQLPGTGFGSAAAAATAKVVNDTVSANAVNGGGGGQRGYQGPAFGGDGSLADIDSQTTHASTRAALANDGVTSGTLFAAGGSAGVTAAIAAPLQVLRGYANSLAFLKGKSTSTGFNTDDLGQSESEIEAEEDLNPPAPNQPAAAGVQQALLDNEESVADQFEAETFLTVQNDQASEAAGQIGTTLADLTTELEAGSGQLGGTAAGNAAAFEEAASELVEESADVAASLAAEGTELTIATVESIALTVVGPEAVITAAPAAVAAVYFAVAGAAAGIAALVGEIQGGSGSASADADQVLGIFLQPGQYTGSGYDLGDLLTGAHDGDIETDNGGTGAFGTAGTAGTARGGGIFTAGPGYGSSNGLQLPTATLTNTIVAGNTATDRQYTVTGYTYSGSATITVSDTSNFPEYPVLDGVATADAADADVTQAYAGGIVSGGHNLVGVGNGAAWAATDSVGTAAAPAAADLTPVQLDQSDGAILAEVGGAATIATGTTAAYSPASAGTLTDQLGNARFTAQNGANTVDIGAVQYNGGPVFQLGDNQTVLTGTEPQAVPGFAVITAASPLVAAANPIVFNIVGDTNPGLFSAAPYINPSGTLSYTLAAGAAGTAALSVEAEQGGISSAAQAFSITADADTAVVVDSNQPGGTVAAGTAVAYSVYPFNPSLGTTFTGSDSASVTIDLPAGYAVSSIVAPGWTFASHTASSTALTATYNAVSGTSLPPGTPFPGIFIDGTFSAAVYAPVLTAIVSHVVAPNTLFTDSNLVITTGATATFNVGTRGAFQLLTNGPATLTEAASDTLPAGLVFDSSDDAISGVPAVGSGGVYTLNFTASNSLGQTYAQAFTITVDEPLSVTTSGSLNFTVGSAGSFTVTANAYPLSIPVGDLSINPAPGTTLPSTLLILNSGYFGPTGDQTSVTIGGTPTTPGSYPLILTEPVEVAGVNGGPATLGTVQVDVTLVVGAPAPVLGSLSAPSAVYGSGPVTLTLTGSGFVAGSVAQFNGAPLATTYVSGTTLRAVVPAADLLAVGNDMITATNGAGLTSAALTFAVTRATPIVTVAIASGTAPAPKATVAGVGGAAVTDGTVTYAYFDANGNALAAAPSAAGSYSVSATFGGDANYLPATSGRVAYSIAAAATLTDVTAKVSVARGGLVYNARTKTYTQTLTITNTSTAALTGPLSLLLTGLSSTATLANATGSTTVAHGSTPAATPYLTLSAGSLAAGGSVTVTLQFTTTTAPTYGLQLLAGAGTL